jgi:hypothetical protein
LQSSYIGHTQKGIVGFAETDPGTCQLVGDERVAVEIAGYVEREVAGHPNTHRPHDRVQHVPVVVQEALSTRLDLTVIGIPAGDLPTWCVGDEGAALLQAGQHTGHALGAFQATVEGFDEVLLAHPFGWGWQDRDALLIGDPPYPGLVGIGALLEDGWLEAGDADDVVEEVHEVLWALQSLEIAVQDDAIPAGVDELDSLAQHCRQLIHGMVS